MYSSILKRWEELLKAYFVHFYSIHMRILKRMVDLLKKKNTNSLPKEAETESTNNQGRCWKGNLKRCTFKNIYTSDPDGIIAEVYLCLRYK